MNNIKKYAFIVIIAFCMLFCGNKLFSQTVNGIHLSDLDAPYVLVMAQTKFLSTKCTVYIDYGQKRRSSWREQRLYGDNKKLLAFNSPIDVINFFSEYDYEFVNAYVVTIGNQQVYHYLLRKNDTQ